METSASSDLILERQKSMPDLREVSIKTGAVSMVSNDFFERWAANILKFEVISTESCHCQLKTWMEEQNGKDGREYSYWCDVECKR